MLIPHSAKINELIRELSTDRSLGLSEEKSRSLLAEYGENRLAEKKKKTFVQRFFEQFRDVMILILIAAAAVSFGIAIHEGNPSEFFEPALIILIVIVNAVVGVMQESKAEKALDALRGMSAQHAKVIRGGKESLIDAAQLVPGDIIRLEAGDFVPADARLITSSSLRTEEAALTGESVPAEKNADTRVADDAPLGDRVNMVFSGCSVTYGSALAVVCATGMKTEMGKIADLLSDENSEQTPLQQRLAQLGKYLGIAAVAACAVIFIIGILNKLNIKDMFMTSISLAVSAIPEGLPAIVTVVLSIGVRRMVDKNAIIRRLTAVETLGSASVICSDKTGTLTQNRMTLVKAYTDGGTTEDTDGKISVEAKNLILLGALCCNGTVTIKDDGSEEHVGDPTETAITKAAMQTGTDSSALNAEYPRLGEIPFDSDRKLMSVIVNNDGKYTVITKGAFDAIATRCTDGGIDAAEKVNAEMSRNALRVLAVAYKEIDALPNDLTPDSLEFGLTFLGLLGMTDPPRPEAKEAVAVCRRAGIRPVMITGDHVITASAIARELGIMQEGDIAVTGAELDKTDDQKLDEKLEHIAVYARVSPENKIRIVKAWQKKGKVVAMTGDGVNDAPALRAADIGCAMGICGTDVAKGAADMTLTDDNFATIVDAVREGRGIYDNIRNVVGFLLGTNIGEVITVFTAMLLWHRTPLLSMQLLWINLVTDSLPAIALGMEAVGQDVMDRPPRPKTEGIFANGVGMRVALHGCMFALLTLIGFFTALRITNSESGGQTLAFMILSMSQLVQAYNMRSEKSVFKIGVFTNRTLNRACLISVLLILAVLFTPARVAFGLMLLPWYLYLIGAGLILVPLLAVELSKIFGTMKHSE